MEVLAVIHKIVGMRWRILGVQRIIRHTTFTSATNYKFPFCRLLRQQERHDVQRIENPALSTGTISGLRSNLIRSFQEQKSDIQISKFQR
jgi:hypothetical protein